MLILHMQVQAIDNVKKVENVKLQNKELRNSLKVNSKKLGLFSKKILYCIN